MLLLLFFFFTGGIAYNLPTSDVLCTDASVSRVFFNHHCFKTCHNPHVCYHQRYDAHQKPIIRSTEKKTFMVYSFLIIPIFRFILFFSGLNNRLRVIPANSPPPIAALYRYRVHIYTGSTLHQKNKVNLIRADDTRPVVL